MNIDELEKLARAAHDPCFPWVDRDALIGGLFAKGEIDYIAAAKPATILGLIERVRELEVAPTQPSQPSGNPGELPEPSDTEILDWLLGDGDTICELTDGSFEYYDYTKGRHKGRTPRDAIKAAMQADKEQS